MLTALPCPTCRSQEELRRANYVTPKNYLDYIGNYKRSLKSNSTSIDEQSAR